MRPDHRRISRRRGGEQDVPERRGEAIHQNLIAGVYPNGQEGGKGVAERRGEVLPIRPDHRCMSERGGEGVEFCREGRKDTTNKT